MAGRGGGGHRRRRWGAICLGLGLTLLGLAGAGAPAGLALRRSVPPPTTTFPASAAAVRALRPPPPLPPSSEQASASTATLQRLSAHPVRQGATPSSPPSLGRWLGGACLAALGCAAAALRRRGGGVPRPPAPGAWAAAGYYGRGFQKAGQMTDEKAWLVANQLVLVKDKPAKDRWAPSELKGDVADPDTAEHPDVTRKQRYPSAPGSGTWGMPLPQYRGWELEEEAEAEVGEVYDPARPVFLDEALAYLDVREGGRYLDASFGLGTFSRAILATADCHVTALDDSPLAPSLAHDVHRRHLGRFDFRPVSFARAKEALAPQSLEPHELFDGVVLDLGPLGEEMDREQKGLTVNDDMFIQDALLEEDMARFLNTAYPELLAYVIYWYGREVQGRALARAILRERRRAPIRTKFQLARVVRSVGERHYVLFDGIDPAKRVFLAIRIYLMAERLNAFLAGLKALLAVDGRLVVCAYHPWLDGLVKNFLDRYTLQSTIPRGPPIFRREEVEEPQVVLLKPIEWLRVLTRVPLSKGQSATHPGWPLGRLRAAERVDPVEEEERQAPKWNF